MICPSTGFCSNLDTRKDRAAIKNELNVGV
jgi:hypothetical protein